MTAELGPIDTMVLNEFENSQGYGQWAIQSDLALSSILLGYAERKMLSRVIEKELEQ